MITPFYAYNWDLWQLYHKVIFDGPNKLIYINPNVFEIDIQDDLYSDWKEWLLISQENGTSMKWAAALRAVGGDPLPGDAVLGRTFFLINGWRIFLDHSVVFTGNLFTEEGDSPFTVSDNVSLATSEVSALVIERYAPNEPDIVAGAVWDYNINDINDSTIGQVILNLQDATILATSLVDSGSAESTASSVQTLLNKDDNYFNNALATIIDSNGNNYGTRQIEKSYSSGQLDLIEPLPFTPTDGASIIITTTHLISRGRIK